MIWKIRSCEIDLTRRAVVMGIVNATPDSFSDGGEFLDPESACAHGLALVEGGAEILDIGGESTRPGSEGVSAEEEIRRVLPVIEALRRATDIPISIDTSKASVARAALEAGADIINDVTGLRGVDLGVRDVAAQVRFYTEVWRLAVVAERGGSVYLRGSGAYCHVLSLHPRSE